MMNYQSEARSYAARAGGAVRRAQRAARDAEEFYAMASRHLHEAARMAERGDRNVASPQWGAASREETARILVSIADSNLRSSFRYDGEAEHYRGLAARYRVLAAEETARIAEYRRTVSDRCWDYDCGACEGSSPAGTPCTHHCHTERPEPVSLVRETAPCLVCGEPVTGLLCRSCNPRERTCAWCTCPMPSAAVEPINSKSWGCKNVVNCRKRMWLVSGQPTCAFCGALVMELEDGRVVDATDEDDETATACGTGLSHHWPVRPARNAAERCEEVRQAAQQAGYRYPELVICLAIQAEREGVAA